MSGLKEGSRLRERVGLAPDAHPVLVLNKWEFGCARLQLRFPLLGHGASWAAKDSVQNAIKGCQATVPLGLNLFR